MSKSDWWFKFEHLKWLTDERLGRCSLQTQGFWMRCLCMMRKSGSATISGTEAELCRLFSVTPAEFKKAFSEINSTKTATVTQTAKNFTLTSRKYAKELKLREQNRLRKRRERRHANVTGVSHDRVRSKEKEVREERKEEEKKRREEGAIAPPALSEIFGTSVLTGIAKTQGIQKLTPSAQREWLQNAELARVNGFTSAEVVECFAEMLKERSGRVPRPEWVNERLPGFTRGRSQQSHAPNRPTGRQLAAQVEAEEAALIG